jgi:hypothetical protein
VIWLNNLAQDLKSRGAFEEAAQCKFNVAALVIGYMALLKPHEAVVIDVASAFQYAPATDHHPLAWSPVWNAWNDITVHGMCRSLMVTATPEVSLPHSDAEGVCTIRQFTVGGLLEELQEAMGLLKQTGAYEMCVDVGYRLLTPIHQKARTYHKLVHTFDELSQLCSQITLGVRPSPARARIFPCAPCLRG